MSLQIKTEISISSKPEDVWKALMDFSAYPAWNPFIVKIQQVSDKKLVVDMKNGTSITTFTTEILKMAAPLELRWRGKLGNVSGLFTGEHYFVLTAQGGGTKFTHGENFSGVLAWLLWPFIKKDIRNNFINMNEALKSLVETL
jgi:hypothetical protein